MTAIETCLAESTAESILPPVRMRNVAVDPFDVAFGMQHERSIYPRCSAFVDDDVDAVEDVYRLDTATNPSDPN